METGSVENSPLLALNKNQPLEGPVRQVYRSAAILEQDSNFALHLVETQHNCLH